MEAVAVISGSSDASTGSADRSRSVETNPLPGLKVCGVPVLMHQNVPVNSANPSNVQLMENHKDPQRDQGVRASKPPACQHGKLVASTAPRINSSLLSLELPHSDQDPRQSCQGKPAKAG